MRRRKAQIIAFSGVDGAGKSTQIELFKKYLADTSTEVVVCWTRGGYTPLFQALKKLLRKLAGRRLPPPGRNVQRERTMGKWWVRRLWLLISILDLALVYGVRVRWWKLRGKTVICDRYIADTRFDFRLNFPDDHAESWLLWRWLEKLAARPDAWFLMLLPVEESMRRCREKNEPFSDSEEGFRQRYRMYSELTDEGDYVVLDARDSIESLFAVIRDTYDRESSRAD